MVKSPKRVVADNPEGSSSNVTSKALKKASVRVEPPKPGCVVYLGRLPHGFYEEQMKAYFSQFGTVSRLRISRNRWTGASKHFGFIEFFQPEVARIVADTMNNYLLFGHVLQCHLVAPEKLHQEMFIGAGRTFKKIPWAKIESEAMGKKTEAGDLDNPTVVEKLLKVSKAKALKAGIDYDFDSVLRCKQLSA